MIAYNYYGKNHPIKDTLRMAESVPIGGIILAGTMDSVLVG